MNLLAPEIPSEIETLQIRVLQYQGMTTQLVWNWPSPIAGHFWLDQILSDLEGISTEFIDIACHCRIERSGSPSAVAWWFSMDLGEISCLINGKPLAASHRLRLNHGDEIELGMARLQVLLSGNPLQRRIIAGIDDFLPNANPEALQEPTAQSNRKQQPADAGSSTFMLTDLITLHGGSSSNTPAADTEWTQMFARALPPDATHRPGASLDDRDVPIGISPVSGPVTLQAQLEAMPGDVPIKLQKEELDPLARLHDEYLFRLRNPYEGLAGDWRNIQQAEHSSEQNDEFLRLRELGGQGSVHDILSKPQNMQGLLEGLDALKGDSLLMPESFESVMQLFAPADFKPGAKNETDTHLPSLTRREHHHLSLDSSINLTGHPISEAHPSKK